MAELHSPGDVQDLLGIDSNTLRKFAVLLEGHGYQIHRNKRGHRAYEEKDMITLRKLIEMSQQQGMTMVEAVLSLVTEEEKTVTDTLEIGTQQTSDNRLTEKVCNHDELVERIEHLEQINADLIILLKDKAIREAYLEEKINQILKVVERTEQLVSESNMLEETKRQIAATSQKKWWKWW